MFLLVTIPGKGARSCVRSNWMRACSRAALDEATCALARLHLSLRNADPPQVALRLPQHRLGLGNPEPGRVVGERHPLPLLLGDDLPASRADRSAPCSTCASARTSRALDSFASARTTSSGRVLRVDIGLRRNLTQAPFPISRGWPLPGPGPPRTRRGRAPPGAGPFPPSVPR